MLTSAGRFLRKLRIDRDERMREMAERLGVSSAFLSAVETGKKNIPASWLSEITAAYRLSPAQTAEMKRAFEESCGSVKLILTGSPPEKCRLALNLAGCFEALDGEAVRELSECLDKYRKRSEG